jgi:hypothetical protein
MAGSMGKNVIVCPPIAYYYCWAENTRWYGEHVKVIKQKNWKDWKTTFEQVQRTLDGKQL